MREIGVRELKAALSQTLRLVGRGERVRVTVHGHPVADIVPAGAVESSDRLRALVASGRLVPPARSRPSHPPDLVDVGRSATAAVLAERDAER